MEFARTNRNQVISNENTNCVNVNREFAKPTLTSSKHMDSESTSKAINQMKKSTRSAFDDIKSRNVFVNDQKRAENSLENVEKNEMCFKNAKNEIRVFVETEFNEKMEMESQIEIVPEDEKEVIDVDAPDHVDPLQYSEYVSEVYAYLRRVEYEHRLDSNFLVLQEDVNSKMRVILIDWLVQVHNRFRLLNETLLLTVQIIDRYLQKQFIARNEFQLLGVTATLIASKYEEMVLPEIKDFVFITDSAYTEAQIKVMEVKILKVIDFDLSIPISLHFLRRYSKAGFATSTVHRMAKYFLEMSILDCKLASTLPSITAAASLCLAMEILQHSKWDTQMIHYTGYTFEYLLPVMRKLSEVLIKNENSCCRAIYKKYADSKNEAVSKHKVFKTDLFRSFGKSLSTPPISMQ